MKKLYGIFFLVMVITFSGCASRVARQDSSGSIQANARGNVYRVRLVNNTDTVLYYFYKGNLSGDRPLFDQNNSFFQAFRYLELGRDNSIDIKVFINDDLKIRYKKGENPDYVEESLKIRAEHNLEVTLEGIKVSGYTP